MTSYTKDLNFRRYPAQLGNSPSCYNGQGAREYFNTKQVLKELQV